MSRYLIQPSRLEHGDIVVPGDKSISHRALMLGAIAEGATRIAGFLEGEDCLATMQAVRQLGVTVAGPTGGDVTVTGVGLHGLHGASGVLDMGNAGTAMRLFMGLLSAQSFDSELRGDASLMR